MLLKNNSIPKKTHRGCCLYIKIPAQYKFISILLAFIESFTEKLAFNTGDIHNIKLSVDEAANNIIKHSYRNKSGIINAEFSFSDDILKIELIHRGNSFDLSKYSEPDLKKYIKERKKGGFGIYLMKNLMDNIIYASKDGTHRIILIKKKK